MRIDRPRWLDLTLSSRLEKLRYMAKATDLDRMELHSMFRSLFTKVVIDWQHDRLIFHWKHGGESVVQAAMKPLRQVENVRRADRPRFKPGELPLRYRWLRGSTSHRASFWLVNGVENHSAPDWC